MRGTKGKHKKDNFVLRFFRLLFGRRWRCKFDFWAKTRTHSSYNLNMASRYYTQHTNRTLLAAFTSSRTPDNATITRCLGPLPVQTNDSFESFVQAERESFATATRRGAHEQPRKCRRYAIRWTRATVCYATFFWRLPRWGGGGTGRGWKVEPPTSRFLLYYSTGLQFSAPIFRVTLWKTISWTTCVERWFPGMESQYSNITRNGKIPVKIL